MEVKLGGNTYTIKELSPCDFVDIQGLIPLSIFTTKKELSREEALKQTLLKEENTKENDIFKQLPLFIEKILGVKKEDAEKYCNEYYMECLTVFYQALTMSIKKFKLGMSLHDFNALNIDILAKRYCKSPIEIIAPNGGYSDLEAYIFNMHVCNIGLKHEAEKQKAQERKMNHGR